VKGSEQNPHLILKTLKDCLETIPQEKQMLVDTLCVTGQMHGVMLWSGQSMKNDFSHQFDQINGNDSKVKTSNLYTWQDQRCSGEFLSSLPKPDSHLAIATGHGCATLLWLHRHQPEMLTGAFDCSGTLMDYLVAGLCGLDKPVTSVQLAASWGYFNTRERSWNYSQWVYTYKSGVKYPFLVKTYIQ
jgi:sedoheptulokinase